jgi:Na+-transporting methylmalonyl-CoA/oxaloacetate decarboxylase gamma subunit
MSQSEALIVTALGMTVVFVGLLLCVAFIQLFSRIAKRVTWGEGVHGEAALAVPPPAAAEPAAVPAEPVPADILAIIATVVEVERKLYVSRPDLRQAPRRPARQS